MKKYFVNPGSGNLEDMLDCGQDRYLAVAIAKAYFQSDNNGFFNCIVKRPDGKYQVRFPCHNYIKNPIVNKACQFSSVEWDTKEDALKKALEFGANTKGIINLIEEFELEEYKGFTVYFDLMKFGDSTQEINHQGMIEDEQINAFREQLKAAIEQYQNQNPQSILNLIQHTELETDLLEEYEENELS